MKNKKVKKPTLIEIVEFLIWIQDYGSVNDNAAATTFIKNHNLEKIHQKLTGNPDSAYTLIK
jgi:hypothetical protein